MADEDNKADETAPDQNAAIPEVEAEIVEADAPAKPSGAFAEDDDPANSPDAPAAEKPAPRMPFTPGVILFFAFAALTIAAFAFWRLQGNNAAAPVDPVSEVERSLEETAPTTARADAEPDLSDDLEDDDEPVADDVDIPAIDDQAESDGQSALDLNATDEAGKIANDAASAIKDASSDIDPVAELADGNDVYLPPLGADNAAAGAKPIAATGGKGSAERVWARLGRRSGVDCTDVA